MSRSRRAVALIALPTLIACGLSARFTPASGAELWTALHGPLAAPPLEYHSAVYDPLRHRMLAFGNSPAIWEMSLDGPPTWHVLTCNGTPPPMLGEGAALYDPVRDRMIVLTGLCDAVLPCTSAVWALSLSGVPTWSEILPDGIGPEPRYGAVAIYDPSGDRVVVYGGENHARVPVADVWSLALSPAPAWTEITPPNPGPGPRLNHAAIYDPVRGRMLVYGGWNFSGLNVNTFGDVWALSLTDPPAWSEVVPAGAIPPARIFTSAVYDAVADRMVISAGQASYSGGLWGDTWGLSLGGSPSWAQIPASGSVPTVRGHATIVDPVANRMILTGGFGDNDDTQTLALPLAGPPVWTLLPAPAPDVSPPRRGQHFALFDDARSRLLVYAGISYESPSYLSDLWSYSIPSGTWSEIPTSGSPLGSGAVAYDSQRDRLIFVSGGWSSFRGDVLNLVVTLNLQGAATWTQVATNGPEPPGRREHSLIYDASGDRLVLFGGRHRTGPGDDIGTANDDTWQLDLGSMTWSQLLPSGTPPARADHQAFYDANRDRMVVADGSAFPGNSGPVPLRDAWVMTLGPNPAWSPLGPEAPSTGFAVQDLAHDQLLQFALGDQSTWSLSLSDPTSWTRVPLTGEVPAPRTGTTLTLDAADDRVLLFGGLESGSLAGLADRGDLWSFDIGAVVDVHVPAASALSLAGTRPNPVVGDLTVGFSLPDATPARIDVFDLAGRIVLRRDVGDLGPGSHVVRLTGQAALAPGIYLLRLHQGRHALVRRVCVIR